MKRLRVKWRCLHCGECCRNLVGRHFGMLLTPDEWRRLNRLARWLGVKLETKPLVAGPIGARLYQVTQEVCPFLDRKRNKCRIYRARPLVCRMFPLSPYGILSCTAVEKAPKGALIEFPDEMKLALNQFMIQVLPVLREADFIYDLNRGWRPTSRYFNRIALRLI